MGEGLTHPRKTVLLDSSESLDIGGAGPREIEPIKFDHWEADDLFDDEGGWIEPSPEAIERMSDNDRHAVEILRGEYLKEFELRKYENEIEHWEGGREAWGQANPVKALRYEKGTEPLDPELGEDP